jgi:hypothetical protein
MNVFILKENKHIKEKKGPVDYPFASRHKGPGFKTPGGYLSETGILLKNQR